MPVDSKHPEYVNKLIRWTKNRDAYEGEDAVKARGQIYLKSASGYTMDEYDRYKSRAKWFGGTFRTVQGMTGACFQKEVTIKASTSVEDHLPSITLTGVSASQFAEGTLLDVMLIGRYGVLLDYNRKLRRPYWSGFPAESIINWHVTYEDGDPKLQMVVFQEESYRISNGFEIELITRYRVCHMNLDGNYEVQIFQESGMRDDRSIQQVESYIPTRHMRPLDFIPFQFFGARDLTHGVARGPLDDLVDVNYSHYRHSGDFEQGLFFTSLPKYVITGHTLEEGKTVPVGSLSAWVFPNPEAKAFLLEYSGQGLASHERAMESDKVEMATLGARLLEESPSTQETLGAVQLRHSGETGALKSMVGLVSEGLTRVLRWHHWWNGDTDNVADERFTFTLNSDFTTTRLAPQELQALMQLWQGGAISQTTLFWNLKQGEVVPNEREFEDEQALIEAEEPARIPFGELPEDEPPAEEEPPPEEEEAAA